MAVLVEGLSVVVRRDAVVERYRGGWDAYVADAPNPTLCSDGEVARIGFLDPDAVAAFVDRLHRSGLVVQSKGRAADLVVVDQLQGPTSRCDWLEVGEVPLRGGKVAACRLRGSKLARLATPDGWCYARSLSARYQFVPSRPARQALRFLRREGDVDVYLELRSGKEVRSGRASPPKRHN
jgi:hypothetical protein